MSEQKPRYITTTLPYVNDDPHFGHALEFIQTDTLARYWRLQGQEVFFNTGTDEHGQKIAQKADEKGESRQAYVDHYAARFESLNREVFGLSFDNFIRTTDPKHQTAAQEIWRRCAAKGDIYKKKYTGLYCVGCELFYKETELLEGNICPTHQKPCQAIEEENYFFKLSNYQTYLEEYLSDEGVIEPEWRRIEALNFVKNGLEDFSISREKTRMDWGISVPDDDSQVMYVWFDALTNYISTLGWPNDPDGLYKKFWENGHRMQMAGKDQIRFQSIMWQAMLKSADLPATEKIFYHGFINSGGHKMSKSLGNVISPFAVVERYGLEATRYLLLRHVHPVDDTDVTWEKMDEWYTANLVNGLGNLVARVMKMAETHLSVPVDVSVLIENPNLTRRVENFQFNTALDIVWSAIKDLDELIQEQEPFKVVKIDKEKAERQIAYLVRELHRITGDLRVFMPETAKTILSSISTNQKPDNLFKRLDN